MYFCCQITAELTALEQADSDILIRHASFQSASNAALKLKLNSDESVMLVINLYSMQPPYRSHIEVILL